MSGFSPAPPSRGEGTQRAGKGQRPPKLVLPIFLALGPVSGILARRDERAAFVHLFFVVGYFIPFSPLLRQDEIMETISYL